jgi:hypothetical protein
MIDPGYLTGGGGTGKKPLIPGHTPGQGFGLTRWLVIGLGALLLWQFFKK